MLNDKLLKINKFSCSSGYEGEQTSIEFNLPLSSGDTGLSVMCLRKFFALGDKTVFDKELKTNLSKWQMNNYEAICLIAGWINQDFQGEVEDIPEFQFEVGTVGQATFVAMKLAGSGVVNLSDLNEHYKKYIVKKGDYLIKIAKMFGFTLQELLDENPEITNPNLININQIIKIPSVPMIISTYQSGPTLEQSVGLTYDSLSSLPSEDLAVSPDKDLVINIPFSDVSNEPFRDSDYYYCIWDSKTTRAQLSSDLDDFISQKSEIALRQAVNSLFEFYSKSKTWEIETRTDSGRVFYSTLRTSGQIRVWC